MSEIKKELTDKELGNVSGGKTMPEKDSGTYWILKQGETASRPCAPNGQIEPNTND